MRQALPLRPYQRDALDAVRDRFAEDDVLRLAVVLPTGGGKTVCFAHQSLEFLDQHPDERVVVLVHTDELVDQAYRKILDVAPHLAVGIVKAARNDVAADVIVASVQSLRNPARRKQLRRVGLVIVDECHHATAATYMAVLTDLGCFGGGARAVGYTATLVRGDGKSLGLVWQDIAFTRDISWMVRRRYLVPPRGIAVEVPDLDLRNVRATRADYREGELGEALAESLAPELVAKAYAEHAGGRRGILFAPTVASAGVFAAAFEAQGIAAAVIHGGMPLDERRALLARHRAGLFQVLCNCMILTEGYDDPSISCIVIARPTKSHGLYVQMVGRGLRVDLERDYDGQDCLILDVVGSSAVHDLRTLVDLSERALDPEKARSGRTLIDLEDEFDAGDGAAEDEPEYWHGPVEAREFDPLARASKQVWLKTAGGTYFVPAGKYAYVFIVQWPERGQWSVAWCGKTGRERFVPDADGVPRPAAGGRDVALTEHRALPLDQAMVWAGDLAMDLGAATLNTSAKAAPWRRKVASQATADQARALGIEPHGTRDPATGLFRVTERAGDLSDRIAQAEATRRIDVLVKRVQGGKD